MNSTAEEILNSARRYREVLKRLKKKPTYRDYERFKSELIQNGIYGKEAELAKILGV